MGEGLIKSFSLNSIIVFFILIFCVSNVFSITGFEKSFAELGYMPLVIEGSNTSKCMDVYFVKEEEENYVPILSINAEFYPVLKGKAIITIKLNGKNFEELNTKELICEESCWARVYFNKDDLLQENHLEICGAIGRDMNKMVITNKSLIGFYIAPLFLKGDFVKKTDKSIYYIGEKIKETVSIHNSGSAAVAVDINFVKPSVEKKLDHVEVIGDTYFSGIWIAPGETKEFTYYSKPKKATEMSLPPAILYYKNAFGEKVAITSNTVGLMIKDFEEKLVGKVLSRKNVFKVGEKALITIAVSNISEKENIGASISLVAEGLTINKEKTKKANIKANETQLFEFEVSSDVEGTFPISCKIKYTDFEKESKCEEMIIKFEKEGINAWSIETILMSVFAVMLVLGIIYYVYLREEKKTMPVKGNKVEGCQKPLNKSKHKTKINIKAKQ